jgi:hypothetical protein
MRMVAFRQRVSMSPLRRPDEIQRLAARTREDTSKSHEDCGAPIGRVLLEIRGASRRPASRSSGATHRRHPKRCGDILGPGAALPVVPRRIEATRRRFRPGVFQAGRPANVGPLRLVVTLPAESGLASAEATRAHLVRRHLRRRDPSPEKQTVCSSRPHGRGMRAL